MRISPAIKGLITSVLMIAVFLGIFYSKGAATGLQYIVYAIYALGIAWTVIAFRHSGISSGKFGELFSHGFKCFIIVTLAMAIFYAIFNYSHPEFATESAAIYKEQLLTAKEKTPAEIESAVSAYRKQYTLSLVSRAIFGYLIIGAGVTAALSALLTKRK